MVMGRPLSRSTPNRRCDLQIRKHNGGNKDEANPRTHCRERPGRGAEVLHRGARIRKAGGLPAAGQARWLTVAPKGQELEFILVQGRSTVDLGLGPEAGT